MDPPPTAFPDIKADDLLKGLEKGLDLRKTGLRPFGAEALAIQPTDDTYRRLLKAQLTPGCLGIYPFPHPS